MTESSQGKSTFRAALVQICATRDVQENVALATSFIREAASQGADYIQTPEVTTLMEVESEKAIAACEPEDGNAALQNFSDLANDLKTWLHIGSMAVRVNDQKLANRSYVFNPNGDIAARYDKIHMFDVTLDNERRYEESETYAPGEHAVIAELPWGKLGLTICYDLRFPYLHRALAKSGAHMIAVPAAFTKTTGQAHWHTLLKARAIETGCFILAAGQTGAHACGRETYGHSLIVSPWGEVLADAGIEPGLAIAEVDLEHVVAVRKQIPALTHDRAFR